MHQGIVAKRFPRPAGRSRPAGFVCAVLASVTATLVSAPASAAPTSIGVAVAAKVGASSFAGSRAWFVGGRHDAADRLIALIATSAVDGVDPLQFNRRELEKAVRRADKDPARVAVAARLLDAALLRYVVAVRRVAPSSEWTVNDRAALPAAVSGGELARMAADSPSLSQFLDTMPWMDASYAAVRRAALEAERQGDAPVAARWRLNLARLRMLPAANEKRYVLVNIAAQRLYMVEQGKVVDSMRVVVGKATQPTPMMAAMIRFTAVNPYWNVPPDLAAERIAPNVVKDGLGYLRQQGYVVLSDWTEQATPVDPATIDWAAVADGTVKIRVRQNPGPANAMGRMKFMFPNRAGVYLHDTPNKELLLQDARLLSGGCVRLEDAPRLASWLYGHALKVTRGMKPEQRVELERPVPVYLAYLTATQSGGEAVYFNDIYGRDEARLRVAAR